MTCVCKCGRPRRLQYLIEYRGKARGSPAIAAVRASELVQKRVTLLPSILLLRRFNGLPLHVVRRIRAASLEGRNVVDHVARAGAGRLACRRTGVGRTKLALGVLASRYSPMRMVRNIRRRPRVRAGRWMCPRVTAVRAAAASCYCGRRAQRKRDKNRRKATHPLPLDRVKKPHLRSKNYAVVLRRAQPIRSGLTPKPRTGVASGQARLFLLLRPPLCGMTILGTF